MAELLQNDFARCAICGIPAWLLRIHKGPWPGPMKSEKLRFRLTVDHIDCNGPSTLENSQPLCAHCNNLKGANELTPEQVLRRVSKWWKNYSGLTLRYLFWLNETPGVGGSPFRNKYMERKELKLSKMKLTKLLALRWGTNLVDSKIKSESITVLHPPAGTKRGT